MAAPPLAKIGILSIGDMGMGIAKLLVANGFAVATNCRGRSEDTITRAKSAEVEILKSDEDLCEQCSIILSVVPPRDAAATAQRIIDAAITGPFPRKADAAAGGGPLYFADLNAVAPSTVKKIADMFDKASSSSSKRAEESVVRFIDGCIIGGPPSLTTTTTAASSNNNKSNENTWKVPSIPTSGPHSIASISTYGDKLARVLNMRHISPEVGAASGLKMCFASLSKGFTALAIQSFTTASRMGVLDDLHAEMASHVPAAYETAKRGLVGMPPKAYRWVREMEEIALTFEEEGGFERGGGGGGGKGLGIFDGVAATYKNVAEDTVLGKEKVGQRKRGLDVDDVAAAMAEGMEKRKKKND